MIKTWAFDILRRAIESPLRQIVSNAGYERLLSSIKSLKTKATLGFNAAIGEYGDMVGHGYFGPTKSLVWHFKMQLCCKLNADNRVHGC